MNAKTGPSNKARVVGPGRDPLRDRVVHHVLALPPSEPGSNWEAWCACDRFRTKAFADEWAVAVGLVRTSHMSGRPLGCSVLSGDKESWEAEVERILIRLVSGGRGQEENSDFPTYIPTVKGPLTIHRDTKLRLTWLKNQVGLSSDEWASACAEAGLIPTSQRVLQPNEIRRLALVLRARK